MRKYYPCFLFAFFFLVIENFSAKAQRIVPDNIPANKPIPCATAELEAAFLLANPNAQTVEQFEGWLAGKIAEMKAAPQSELINPAVTVPVIFHVIHNNEAIGSGRNVATALIHQQVLQVNKDFANQSNSIYPVSADMGIRYALAQNDPDGNPLPEPGINRINRNDRGWSAPPYTVGYANVANNYLTNTIKPNSIWDPSRYLNIWVSEWEAGILGIATFPSGSGLSGIPGGDNNSTAGVAISYITVGSLFSPQGCGSYGKGRTLTHELGHFWGLRHIWGDGLCATDYCNDTPTHQTNNSGEPIHPKPNNCGTTDEMFENYMDYTNDIVQNTFTENQGDRMQAVFLNSPRRGSLATSNAGLVSVTGSNRIAFADCDGQLLISENVPGNICPRYRDISLQLNVEDRATATTTVTINIGGTATNGIDYELLTPSVTFNNGDYYKAVVLRIWDNTVPAGTRTIIVSYSIGTGGGVTAGTNAQTMTITVEEDDFNIDIDQTSPVTVTIFAENFGTTSGSNQVPAGWASGNVGSATNKWVVNSANAGTYGFSGNTAHISNGDATAVNNGTAGIAYTNTITTDARLFTTSIDASSFKNLQLSFDYVSNGQTNTDVGIVYYSINGANYTAFTNQSGGVQLFQNVSSLTHATLNLPLVTFGASDLSFLFRWLTNNAGGNNPPFTIDNVTVTGDKQTIETEAGQSASEIIFAGTDNYFYSFGNKDVIARLSNATEQLGCVTATVLVAGNGRTPVVTTGGPGFRSNKIVRISPAVANTSSGYELTLYFTTDEMADWPAGEIPNLRVLKLINGAYISNNYTTADGHIVPTTFSDHSEKGYYVYTAVITDGFSDFMLVSEAIVLPVHLVDFKATPSDRSILLTWATVQESNNKGFVIERSLNGISFEPIGWVDEKTNSSVRTGYAYRDNFVQPGLLYYYRLRQTDWDNRETLSEIRSARIEKTSGLAVTIHPNPAHTYVQVFVSGLTGSASLVLINVDGKIVRNWQQPGTAGTPYRLDITGLPPGLYFIRAETGLENKVGKLVIQ